MAGDDIPEHMPVRRLHNFVYCPRLFHLQWVEHLFEGNADTAEGDLVHRRVDQPNAVDLAPDVPEGATIRSLAITSDSLGLSGVIDCLEVGQAGMLVVDHKRGSARRTPDGGLVAKDNDRIQVGAYALMVQDAGHPIAGCRIWYAADRRSVSIPFDDDLITTVHQTITAARTAATAQCCPPPLLDDPRCLYCSVYPICLPNESAWWSGLVAEPPLDRRPPRPDGDDGELIVVQDPKARVGCRAGAIVVELGGTIVTKHPLEQVTAIHLYGPVQISTQALHALMERGLGVAWFSPTGRYVGHACGLGVTGVDARRGQYRWCEEPSFQVPLVREIIRAKIHNQRVLLMRNGHADDAIINQMASLRDRCANTNGIDSLRGLEGSAAALYFAHFSSMINVDDPPGAFDFTSRNRRPPRDPVNALLSLGYSLLAKELTGIITSVGLDPFLGFFHRPRFGRPALALDMMEEFRPLIADSVAISLVNRNEIGPGDFVSNARGTFLNEVGRKQFWRAWFRRMDDEVTHPQFGYRMSYRRMLEVQVRQLWRLVRGEAQRYHGFTTR